MYIIHFTILTTVLHPLRGYSGDLYPEDAAKDVV